MKNDQIIYIISVVIIAIAIAAFVYMNMRPQIPIVIIAYNNLFFVRNFIDQLKKFDNPIILMDNNSTYPLLLEYYKELKQELGSRVDIRLLEKNHGSNVTYILKDSLPEIYILSDPDLGLNPRMPANFAEILLKLSREHEAYKVGLALDLSDKEKFLKCKQYTHGKTIYEWEKKFWEMPIPDDHYELYKAPTDTTFCLINRKFPEENQIRVAGDFTVKHLPWYKNFLKDHISEEELAYWKRGNNSSSILITCITD